MDDGNSAECEHEPINEKMELRHCIEEYLTAILECTTCMIRERCEELQKDSKKQMDVEREERRVEVDDLREKHKTECEEMKRESTSEQESLR